MTTQLPGDLKDGGIGGLDGGSDPIEPLPSVAADARVLIERAAISEEKLQADWAPKPAPVEPPVEEPPAEDVTPFANIVPHHLVAAYDRLKAGATVEEAARIAEVPLEAAQAIADEIVAVCTKLGAEVPTNCKPRPVQEPGPIEPVEDPIP